MNLEDQDQDQDVSDKDFAWSGVLTKLKTKKRDWSPGRSISGSSLIEKEDSRDLSSKLSNQVTVNVNSKRADQSHNLNCTKSRARIPVSKDVSKESISEKSLTKSKVHITEKNVSSSKDCNLKEYSEKDNSPEKLVIDNDIFENKSDFELSKTSKSKSENWKNDSPEKLVNVRDSEQDIRTPINGTKIKNTGILEDVADFNPSDEQGDSTKIFANSFSEKNVRQKLFNLTPALNNKVKQTKDSGIEEDDKEDYQSQEKCLNSNKLIESGDAYNNENQGERGFNKKLKRNPKCKAILASKNTINVDISEKTFSKNVADDVKNIGTPSKTSNLTENTEENYTKKSSSKNNIHSDECNFIASKNCVDSENSEKRFYTTLRE